jgi:PAS domain S-box-containing protein
MANDSAPPPVADSLQDFFEGLSIGLYRTNIEGRLLYVNASLVEMLGYPDMATLLAAPTAVISPVTEERNRWYKEIMRHGRVRNFKLRLRRYNGQFIWGEDNARVIYNPDGSVAYFEGIMEDVTAQVAAQEALTRAEVMREVAQTVNASLDRDEVLRRSLHQLRRVLTFDTGSVYIYTEGIKSEIIVSSGYQNEQLTISAGSKLLANSPILQRMSQDRQPVLSPDVRRLPGWIWVPGAEHVRSFMAVPLIAREQMIGALMLDAKEPDFFDQTHLQIVQTLAQSVAIAVENARLFGMVQRSLADQSALFAATTAVSGTLDLSAALTRLSEQMCKALQAAQVHIFSWNETEYTVRRIAGYEAITDPASRLLPAPDLLLSHERLNWLHKNQPMQFQVNDPYLPPFLLKRLRQAGMSSALYVPITAQNAVVGFAELFEEHGRRSFTHSEIALAQGMAQQAAISFENARLYQAEARRRREAETLHKLAGYLTATLDLNDVFTRAVEAVRQNVADLQGCAISLLEDNGRTFCLRYNWAAQPEYVYIPTDTRLAVQQTYVSAAVLQSRQPVIIENLQQAAIKNHRFDQPLSKGIRALMYFPLLIQGRPIGVLHLNFYHAPRRFSPEEIALCQGVANQTAIAVENARLFAAERRQLSLSQTLQQVGALLTAQLSLDDLFDQIFTLLGQVVKYDSVSIQLVSGEKTYLAAGRGFPDFDLSAEIVSKIAAPTLQERWGETHKGYVLLADTHLDPDWDVSLGNEYIRSWIGAPLVVKERLLGALNVDNATPYAYDDETGETVAAFANQAAVAIENARLYAETQRRANELAVLNQVALATTAVVNTDDLLTQTTETIAQLVYRNSFGFLLIDAASQTMRPHSSYRGLTAETIGAIVPLDRGIVGQVALTGRPALARDVRQEARYYEITGSTQSEVTVPLILRQEVVGVINAESPELNAFDENDVNFLTTLAGQVSIALERAQLYESLQQHTVHLEREVAKRTGELRAASDRTQAILDGAGEGIFFTDSRGEIQYANQAMARLTGYEQAEMLNKTADLWRPLTEGSAAYQPFWNALHNGESWSGELISVRKDGQMYDASLTIAPIFSDDGQLTGFVGIQSDISRFKEVDRLKSRFISNVSHELRTPLTSIRNSVTLLQRGKIEQRDYYLHVLKHQTDRLTRLIQDVLDISRLESELAPVQLNPLPLRQLILDFCASLTPKAEMGQIHLHLDLPDQLPPVLGELALIESVLSNLLNNALAYTPQGSAVTVSAGVDERNGREMVWFQVADNGAGVPPEDLPRLFDRFYRGRTTQERNIPGTGLGLAICQEIVNRHQGEIEVDNRPGEGVAFTVWLQLAPSD